MALSGCPSVGDLSKQLNMSSGKRKQHVRIIAQGIYLFIFADLMYVYKIVFGPLCVASSAFFVPKAQSQLRGHPYTLSKQRCSSSDMHTFVSSRVINMWNSLAASSTHFSSVNIFCKTVPNTYLINFCRVDFTCLL